MSTWEPIGKEPSKPSLPREVSPEQKFAIYFVVWCILVLIGTFNPLRGGAMITAVCAKIAGIDCFVALLLALLTRGDRKAWLALGLSLAALSIWILPYSRQVGP